MRAFSCDHCHSPIAFENTLCATCGSPLAYDRGRRTMVVESLEPPGLRFIQPDGRVRVPCANLDLANCNWLTDEDAIDGLCSSCQLTRTRPANDDPVGLLAFVAAETAKRRLLFQLDELGLPSTSRFRGPGGMAFDLLSSTQGSVVAGQRDGLITIDLSAQTDDDPSLASWLVEGVEPTMLGRLRREVGQWYFTVLVAGTEWSDRLEALAVQESAADVFAASFAQYLDLRDGVETALSVDLHVGMVSSTDDDDPGSARATFDDLIARWLPLASALNAMSRSRGESEPYPGPFSDVVLARLRFVHDRISVR